MKKFVAKSFFNPSIPAILIMIFGYSTIRQVNDGGRVDIDVRSLASFLRKQDLSFSHPNKICCLTGQDTAAGVVEACDSSNKPPEIAKNNITT